jgi:hypothetical protein
VRENVARLYRIPIPSPVAELDDPAVRH